MTSTDVLDDIMVEALLADPNPALPGTSGQDSGLDKDNCNSRTRDKRPYKPSARKAGTASPIAKRQ